MWRFKPFTPKEASGLEGRCIDVGNLKVQIKNIIAEGGFSCVYLARDAVNPSKPYAVKHIISNDQESLELVKKEISVMKSLKGHPNIVTLYAHSIFDMGRTNEAFLVMEFCERSLVHFLESRGAGYLEETQVLKIFRDVCNAVFALHCQSPPIAHRDLKAENILLESNGSWKLCDFGSTSTNHKCFERPEEMGIEEDNIRKHTTPAYRAPEMWDLFRRDLINEKVDIWALGCLLFRICYFKSAFDGESKLQVLNGNYRIPDLPKYCSSITDLVRDMLQSSPDARPDITQKSLPDRPPEMHQATDGGMSKPKNNAAVPHRTPTNSSKGSGESGGPLGAFWASQHAQDCVVGAEKTSQRSDNESIRYSTSKQDHVRIGKHHSPGKTSPSLEEKVQVRPSQRISSGESLSRPKDDGSANDIVARFPKVDPNHNNERSKESRLDNTATFQDEAFNTFVADFNTARSNAGASFTKLEKDSLEAEVEKLRQQLTQANSEKAELTSKFEKLSTICRSQQQEIMELKQALGGRNQLPSKGAAVKSQSYTGNVVPGTAQQGEVKPWNAFPDVSSPQVALKGNKAESVRTRSDHQRKTNAPGGFSSSSDDGWGFGADTFTATPTSSSSSRTVGNSSQRSRDSNNGDNKPPSQPAGWAGF